MNPEGLKKEGHLITGELVTAGNNEQEHLQKLK